MANVVLGPLGEKVEVKDVTTGMNVRMLKDTIELETGIPR